MRHNLLLFAESAEYLESNPRWPFAHKVLHERGGYLLPDEPLLLGAAILSGQETFALRPTTVALGLDELRDILAASAWPLYLGDEALPVHTLDAADPYMVAFHDITHYVLWQRWGDAHRTDTILAYDTLQRLFEETTDSDWHDEIRATDRCLTGPLPGSSEAFAEDDFYARLLYQVAYCLPFAISPEDFFCAIGETFRGHPRSSIIANAVARVGQEPIRDPDKPRRTLRMRL